MAAARAAIHEQVAAAARADVSHGHRLEGLGSPSATGEHPSGISAAQMADKQCLPPPRGQSVLAHIGPAGAIEKRIEKGFPYDDALSMGSTKIEPPK
jgi:hypothetical protein